jgi:hypothetical protein
MQPPRGRPPQAQHGGALNYDLGVEEATFLRTRWVANSAQGNGSAVRAGQAVRAGGGVTGFRV